MKNIQLLFEQACSARTQAYAPYSQYYVGACIESENGELFSGCNIENAAYSVGICAESNALAQFISAGQKRIKQVMVVVQGPGIASPCGACRQRLFEFSDAETIVHMRDLCGNTMSLKLHELLPHGFGPTNLIQSRKDTSMQD